MNSAKWESLELPIVWNNLFISSKQSLNMAHDMKMQEIFLHRTLLNTAFFNNLLLAWSSNWKVYYLFFIYVLQTTNNF